MIRKPIELTGRVVEQIGNLFLEFGKEIEIAPRSYVERSRFTSLGEGIHVVSNTILRLSGVEMTPSSEE